MTYLKAILAKINGVHIFQPTDLDEPTRLARFGRMLWRVLQLIAVVVVSIVGGLELMPEAMAAEWLEIGYSGVVAAGREYGFDILVLISMPVLTFLAKWVSR